MSYLANFKVNERIHNHVDGDRGVVLAVDYIHGTYRVLWDRDGEMECSFGFLHDECWADEDEPKPGAGFKADAGKDRWELLPLLPIIGVVKVITYGANGKYKDLPADNWRRLENGKMRYYAAALRHIFKWVLGEKIDPESGLPHLHHALTCLVFVAELDNES